MKTFAIDSLLLSTAPLVINKKILELSATDNQI